MQTTAGPQLPDQPTVDVPADEIRAGPDEAVLREAIPDETIEEVVELADAPRSPTQKLAEVIVTGAILLAVLAFFLTETPVVGTSMEPTLANGQRLLVSRSTYLLSAPQRGDVVLLRDPLNSGQGLARRVIGLPSEKVEMRGRQVLINNQPLNETYLNNSLLAGDNLTGTVPYQLKDDELFVMADNRLTMSDSRTWGPVRFDTIIGRAWLVYWPPDDIGVVKHEHYP